VVRQLLAESLVLSLSGAALGLLGAIPAVRLLSRVAADRVAYVDGIRLDPVVLGFAVLLGVVTGVLFGLAPALSGAKVDLAANLKEGARTTGAAASHRLNDAFPVVPGLNRDTFWRESQVCGGYAQWLANGIGSDADQAWLTGFMVRLGELVMAQNIPGCLNDIEKLPHHPGARWQRESAVLGFTEGQVTAEMARRWNFPGAVVHALDASADPMAARPFARLGAVLHLAELLADTDASTTPDAVDSLPADVRPPHVDADWMRSRRRRRRPSWTPTLH
jgi:hypothetical protein